MRTWLALGLVGLAGGIPVRLAAQDIPADRVLRGLIVDSVSRRPVSGAVVYFEGRRDEFHSGSEGQFHIPGVHVRDTVLVIRRIGYVPLRVSLPKTDSPLAVDLGALPLRPVATQLDRIAVETEEVARFPQLAEFYRRKQSANGGAFVTREDIERSAARQT